MSTVNEEPLMGREEGRKLCEEADKLLNLAERLQDKREQYERWLWMLIAIGLVSAAIGAVGAYLTCVLPKDSIYKTLMVPFAFLVPISLFCLYYAIAKIRRILTRERRAIHRIVDMLRDLEKGIADKDNLSTLERVEFRIRLSRFDIGPG